MALGGGWGNVELDSPMAWERERDGGHRVQAQPGAGEKRQELSAHHVSTRHS